MSIDYIFTQDDRNLAMKMLTLREVSKRRHGVKTQKVDNKRSDADVDFFGALGEIVFARHFNQKIALYESLGGDAGYDFKINGLTIDTKQTKYKTGRLIVRPGKQNKAHIYVLIIGKSEKMSMVGWAFGGDFNDKDRMKVIDLGYGDNLTISQKKLRPMEHLKVLLN